MVPVAFGRRSEESGRSVARVNVIAILVGSVVLGVIGLMATGNPSPLVAMLLVGVVPIPPPSIYVR
jgi:hypothetical protein